MKSTINDLDKQDDWTNWLAAAEFQYNDKKHAATG